MACERASGGSLAIDRDVPSTIDPTDLGDPWRFETECCGSTCFRINNRDHRFHPVDRDAEASRVYCKACEAPAGRHLYDKKRGETRRLR